MIAFRRTGSTSYVHRLRLPHPHAGGISAAPGSVAPAAAAEAATGLWLAQLETGRLPRVAAPGLGSGMFGAWQRGDAEVHAEQAALQADLASGQLHAGPTVATRPELAPSGVSGPGAAMLPTAAVPLPPPAPKLGGTAGIQGVFDDLWKVGVGGEEEEEEEEASASSEEGAGEQVSPRAPFTLQTFSALTPSENEDGFSFAHPVIMCSCACTATEACVLCLALVFAPSTGLAWLSVLGAHVCASNEYSKACMHILWVAHRLQERANHLPPCRSCPQTCSCLV